jgi:hypothetical protein
MNEQPITRDRLTFLPSSVVAVEIADINESYEQHKVVQIWLRGLDKPVELKRWLTYKVPADYMFPMYRALTEEEQAARRERLDRHKTQYAALAAVATIEADALRDEVALWLRPVEVAS